MKARKNVGVDLLVSLIAGIIIIAAMVVFWPMIFPSTDKITIGGGVFNAKVAMDDVSRQNSWTGVKNVNYNQALLMVYPKNDKWIISMKDMKTSVDIVWLDYSKKVVYYVNNAEIPTSTSYRTYNPNSRAKYVLELAPGTISARSIKIGDKAEFNIDESELE